jgi:hypothetical protein
VAAAGLYSRISEEPGETEGVGNALTEAVGNLRLLLLGSLGALAQAFSLTAVIFVLSVLGLVGAAMGRSLNEVT